MRKLTNKSGRVLCYFWTACMNGKHYSGSS
jgi:hypothetical protein